MSSLPSHRQRDRGGGTKPLTPNSISNKNSNSALKKSSSGKENPRPALRPQKPTMRSVPRVEKSAGENSDSRVRWSTSSAPRGRSQSPSEFIRVFSDMKKDKVSRVSVEKKGSRDLNVKRTELGSHEKRRFSDFKENNGIGFKMEKKCEKEMNSSGVRVLGSSCKKDVTFTSTLEKSNGVISVNGNTERYDEKGRSYLGSKVEICGKDVSLKRDDKVEKIDACVDLGLKESDQKSFSDSKVLETFKEKGVNEEGSSAQVGIKYPSKLHEKLTFLEGKVKRIASDIKRTKEMLDMNNPDATKVILSDIQEKITGIEKAMGSAAGDSEGKIAGVKNVGNDNAGSNIAEKSKCKRMESVNSLGNELKSEELEARLFPHHKLLRNRIPLKSSSGSSQSLEPNTVGSSNNLKVETLLSPVEDNPIALEFLASLDKDQIAVTSTDGQGGLDLECCEVLETDEAANSGEQGLSNMFNGKGNADLILTTDERFDEFEDQENVPGNITGEETEDSCIYQLNEIGLKTSTGGWFVSEGESVLLAHNDGSCSFYDIANCEDKAVYKPPAGVSLSIWRDCWIIRAASADGCSGRYVVAASAGNTLDSGFCSWDFYTKDVRAFHVEDGGTTTSRTVLAPLPNNNVYSRNALSSVLPPESQQWWYKPCGPLIVSTASSQRVVKINDIRDGEQIMKWEVQKPVLTMDYSSPLQWRNREKVVIAESESISLWDVNSLNPEPLLSVSSGRKISALHVNNTDAELGGGVRQRVTSAEAEGNDGVFCTHDSINILDFRHPTGVGLKIPKFGINVQSVYSRGDSVFLGCSNIRSAGKKQSSSQVQQFSLRKQRLFSTYSLPESSAHPSHSAITQVWGNSNLVMGVSGLGLFVFDALVDDGLQSFTNEFNGNQKVREIIGPDDLYAPSFDYLASRVLLISRDRPASWRHLF
ncbi:KIN14B-interacting protein At4g14310-like [Pistacia vera]|uniref:KIN14B-interacting protein At4g14310-like n=1 Tax=Pistacia vera TaxID=55513 RepID=UPI001263784B|nr:KIN14B-interacting protein At4g14310-like [Pistacia vera]